jgi:hypothetical protein
MALDHALQKYYEDTFSMMATAGWATLIEDFKELEKNLVNVRTVKDEQSLNYRLGQLDMLDLILRRKDTCEKVYEELLNEDHE